LSNFELMRPMQRVGKADARFAALSRTMCDLQPVVIAANLTKRRFSDLNAA
jgi:hypothetical protein